MITIDQIFEAVDQADAGIDMEKLLPESKFEDLGADSLDMFNIVMEVQELAGVDIPDDAIEDLMTPKALMDYLNKIC